MILGRSKSSISREVRKGTAKLLNSDLTYRYSYSSSYSQVLREDLKSRRGRRRDSNIGDILEFIQTKLDEKYSPDVISYILKSEGIYSISTQTIYNYLMLGILKKDGYKIRKKYSKNIRKRRSYKNSNSKSIEERQFQPDERIFGNWEMDTVIGAKGSKAVLLVLTERYSRYELILKLKDKTQESVINALNLLERKHKHDFQKLFKSITVDNGVEFLDHSSNKSPYQNT